MTKTSDRYARWFGTRVPFVSRGGIALFTLFAAIVFSVIIFLRFSYTIFGVNFWLVIGLSLLVGALFHFLILFIIQVRYKNPLLDDDFYDLISRVHQRVVVDSRTHIWTRYSDDAFIASNFNPLYNAIIVSEPMVDLILQSPESGEVLIAFNLLRVPRQRWFADLIGSTILFTILSYLSSAILIPLLSSLWNSIIVGYYYILLLLIPLSTYLLLPFIFALIAKGAFWRHEPAFVGTESIYGMHPQVAKIQVELGKILDEDEVNGVIYDVRKWEKSKRSYRRLGICAICAVPSFILGLFLISWIGYFPYGIYFRLFIYLPFIIAAAVAAIIFLVLRRWDKQAMGEVFQKTTDYDEPIWMD
jgi:hypothetical protein